MHGGDVDPYSEASRRSGNGDCAAMTPGVMPQRRSALRLVEERLRRVQLAADVGAFDLDLATNALLVTPHVATLFGRDPRPAALSFDDCEQAVAPEDVAALRDA